MFDFYFNFLCSIPTLIRIDTSYFLTYIVLNNYRSTTNKEVVENLFLIRYFIILLKIISFILEDLFLTINYVMISDQFNE